eukprot:PhM_4_TR12660/c0_g1_i1/m.74574
MISSALFSTAILFALAALFVLTEASHQAVSNTSAPSTLPTPAPSTLPPIPVPTPSGSLGPSADKNICQNTPSVPTAYSKGCEDATRNDDVIMDVYNEEQAPVCKCFGGIYTPVSASTRDDPCTSTQTPTCSSMQCAAMVLNARRVLLSAGASRHSECRSSWGIELSALNNLVAQSQTTGNVTACKMALCSVSEPVKCNNDNRLLDTCNGAFGSVMSGLQVERAAANAITHAKDNKKSSSNVGAIVGGVIGGAVVIGMAAYGYVVYRRRQQQQSLLGSINTPLNGDQI